MREYFKNLPNGACFQVVEDVTASLKSLQREPILRVYTKNQAYMLVIGADGEKRQISPDTLVVEVVLAPAPTP